MGQERPHTSPNILPAPEAPVSVRRRLRRMAKDLVARHTVAGGGVGVIIAILLIFFYLFYVVIPLFKGAGAREAARYPVPAEEAGDTLHLALEEQVEIGVRFTSKGHAVFFSASSGALLEDIALPLPPGVSVTGFAAAPPPGAAVAFGLSDGRALVLRHAYGLAFEGDTRTVVPRLEYPLGDEPVTVDPEGWPLRHMAVAAAEEGCTLAAATEDGRLLLADFARETSFLSDSVTVSRTGAALPPPPALPLHLLINPQRTVLYAANIQGGAVWYDIRDRSAPVHGETVALLPPGLQATSMALLTGGISLIVGDSTGRTVQWFPVRDPEGNRRLTRIREFPAQDGPIRRLAPEYNRKGFLAGDDAGRLGIYHATSGRTVLVASLSAGPMHVLAVAPRADALLAEDGAGTLHFWEVDNPHPEVSWSALWGRVWYEDYPEPAHVWQSSSASDDFEPKFSLVPLSFGTLKAAFYAMLFAVPLAILGAISTAHFMRPRMRALVKPSIEVMEALPTVILGFLAGLWLAPFAETHLPGIFAVLVLVLPAVLLASYGWSRLPERIRLAVPDGWESALLVPVVILVGWAGIECSPFLERWLFNGDMRNWLSGTLGLTFDQRNSVVVGIAMGFAVIPTIFSITEDAIFGVPKHLAHGSLALGATPWQTLVRVVLLTASPGIFSAVMIGLGRAVGETMIVLMATGNTPIMDFNMFQGMRTLSANIAVEMPETEVHSTHFRILFLSGLVLFALTFAFNTAAEVIRQRLRRKYSSL